jgi:hypothetical protein
MMVGFRVSQIVFASRWYRWRMHHMRRLVLLFSALVIGLSACSLTSQPTQETTTPVALRQPADNLVLFEDGLGPFDFGDGATEVIEGVTATIGGWDSDSSDNDALTPLVCDQRVARAVSWGSLVLVFVERDGAESFTGWAYGFDPITGNSVDNRDLGLSTPEGVRLGSSRSDLVAAYDGTISLLDDGALDTATFRIAGNGPTHLAGKLDSADSSGRVDFLETTPSC